MLSPEVQQALLVKASQDAQGYPSDQAAQYIGAGLGAYVGAMGPGQLIHSSGRGYERMMDRVAPQYEVKDGEKVKAPRGNKMRPGGRMAGGLVGMILGGALGPGIRNEAIGTSPAAALLAKAQSGTFTEADAYALQNVLGQTYSQMGIV